MRRILLASTALALLGACGGGGGGFTPATPAPKPVAQAPQDQGGESPSPSPVFDYGSIPDPFVFVPGEPKRNGAVGCPADFACVTLANPRVLTPPTSTPAPPAYQWLRTENAHFEAKGTWSLYTVRADGSRDLEDDASAPVRFVFHEHRLQGCAGCGVDDSMPVDFHLEPAHSWGSQHIAESFTDAHSFLHGRNHPLEAHTMHWHRGNVRKHGEAQVKAGSVWHAFHWDDNLGGGSALYIDGSKEHEICWNGCLYHKGGD